MPTPQTRKFINIDTAAAASPILNEKIYKEQLEGRNIELGSGHTNAGGYKQNSIFYKYDNEAKWIWLSHGSKIGKRGYLMLDDADSC